MGKSTLVYENDVDTERVWWHPHPGGDRLELVHRVIHYVTDEHTGKVIDKFVPPGGWSCIDHVNAGELYATVEAWAMAKSRWGLKDEDNVLTKKERD